MPLARNTDLRVQKTRMAIKNTFKDMICEMGAADITIKELSERAMIHKKTFYLHYTSIEALFEDILQDLAKNTIASTLLMPILTVQVCYILIICIRMYSFCIQIHYHNFRKAGLLPVR